MRKARSQLNIKELKVQKGFLSKIRIPKRKTKKPVVIGIIGLVGAGKTTVAKELAKQIGAVVIEPDAIRIALRRQKAGYDNVRLIVENITSEILKGGGNVVIDSDFVDKTKRDRIQKIAKDYDAKMMFLRVYCSLDVMIGRILSDKGLNLKSNFFGGASSQWKGKNRGQVVKLREMIRRIAHHYNWSKEGGGKWVLRKLQIPLIGEIDTSDGKTWKKELKRISQKLKK